MVVRARRLVSLLFAACLHASSTRAIEPEQDWVHTRTDDGIESFRSAEGAGSRETLRAVTEVQGDVWSLLAILEDVDRACEWTAHCAEMRRVRRYGPRDMLVYARMDAPWPVRDRDVVTRVRLELGSLHEIQADIQSVADPSVPANPGVVRMPSMRARYAFRVVGPERVRVSYEVSVDPGGTLPDWLKRLVARDLAHDTLERLRGRTAWARTSGIYRARAGELAAIARADLGERVQAQP